MTMELIRLWGPQESILTLIGVLLVKELLCFIHGKALMM